MGMNIYRNSKRGTSLVEILVVMVVLLVGIMTVVQMFPSGFRAVKAAENQTIAVRLAQQELERWKNLSANLPDGILPIDRAGTILNNQKPGPPFDDITDVSGTNPVEYELGNALNIRQVEGETTPIPVASYFQTGSGTVYGSRYTLAFSPIDVQWDETTGTFNGLKVKSGDLRRFVGDSGRAAPAVTSGQYAIDYNLDGGTAEFYVAFPRNTLGHEIIYNISYSYWEDEGGEHVLKSDSQEIPVSADYDGDWINVKVGGATPPPNFVELDRYSDTCARAFRALGRADAWSNDPYEFKLADYILGVLAFNPAGHGLYERTARGVRPIVARVDYRIHDLRIIREDRAVPAANSGATAIPVKLSLKFIMNAGDPSILTDGDPTDNVNEPTFEGLITDSSGSVLVTHSILVLDLATGLRINVSNNDIDFKAGIVNLPVSADLVDYNNAAVVNNIPLEGRHLRFFYKSDGDWMMQCTKAYTSYTRDRSGGAVNYRSFRLQGNAAKGYTNRLLFADSEIDKSVVVDYTYYTNNGVEHKVTGEKHKIQMDTRPGVNDVYIDLDLPAGGYLTGQSRIVVVGTSFNVKVIWRDGARWRHVNMSTNLTRT